MDCVNHSGVSATAYCQNCGKALCANCIRTVPGGQILCEPCWVTLHSFQQPFGTTPPGGPNPSAAAFLGLIPGVGAMYNGQFLKGLIHVFIFAVLVSTADHYPIFGLFIAAWILYQSFEAYHTAKARRDGEPLPDPLGLNEVGNWLNLGGRPHNPGQPGTGPVNPNPGGVYPGAASAGPQAGGYQQSYTGQAQPPYTPPYEGQHQTPYQQAPWQTPYQGQGYQGSAYPGVGQSQPGQPGSGFVDPAMPPVPPPPIYWKRKEPIGAMVLIGLGLLFLLKQMDFLVGRLFEFAWPLVLIGLGAWLVVRSVRTSQGGSK